MLQFDKNLKRRDNFKKEKSRAGQYGLKLISRYIELFTPIK